MSPESFPTDEEVTKPESTKEFQKNTGNKILSREKQRTIGQKILSLFKKNNKTRSEKYYLLSDHLSPEENKAWKELIIEWDEKVNINMDEQLGELIEQYIKDPNYQFGVHRSEEIDGANYKDDTILNNIMKNGLRVFGDLSSGSSRNNAPPNKTVRFCDNILTATILTKSSRRGSTGAVLVAIPSEFIDKDGELLPGKTNSVYN